MQNNAQPYQEESPTPKQDMQRQPQLTQRDQGIMPPHRTPMPQHGKPGERDEGESNVKQSTRNNAEARNEANESIQAQQAERRGREGKIS